MDNFLIISQNAGSVAFAGEIIIIRGSACGRSVMKLDPLKFGSAFGIIGAVVFAVYGLAAALFGEDESWALS